MSSDRQPLDAPRTLIVYLHGIGDNIMLSGVLKEYKRFHPDELIDLVLLNAGCVAIWAGNPLVSSAIVYPGRQPHFWNPVEFWLRSKWQVRRYIAEQNRTGRYGKVFFPGIQTLPEILYHVTGTYGDHKVDRIAAEFGVSPRRYPYDLQSSAGDQEKAEAVLGKLGSRRIAVMHPFSGHAKKRFSAETLKALVRSLQDAGLQPLIVGANAEQAQFDRSLQIESAFGLSFGVLIELLRKAEMFIGTDSAVAHLAAFANTPRLVIVSPKLKPSRYEPISERSKITLVESTTAAVAAVEIRR